MAALLNVETEGLAQVLQYEDDSLEAWFTDGARILLTACASVFTRQEDKNDGLVHPPTGASVHQFTAYAVQGWRERVRQLVTFRNYFAERPFLAQSLITTELQTSQCGLQYAAWPSSLEMAINCKLIHTNSHENTRLTSSDGYAWAELASHGQTVTLCYLARLPSEKSSQPLEDSLSRLSMSRETKEDHCLYARTRAIYSMSNTPERWHHPISILLQHRAQCGHMTSGVLEKENERADTVVSSPLPLPLPLTCHQAHLHHPHTRGSHRLKVLLAEGILYRIIRTHSETLVEALPNQNTVLRSHDQQGRFFKCWSTSDCVSYSMYCVDYPPPSTDLPFSMSRVLGQMSRLLEQALKQTRPHPSPCWQPPCRPLPSPPSSSLHYTVPGLGRFTARANGHIRCVFADHTVVDFFSSSLNTIDGQNSSCPPLGGKTRGVEVAQGVWIGDQLCRVMQPNGRYVMVGTQHPASFYKYIELVKEWSRWLAQPEEERGHFCQRTVYDQHTQRQVLAELSRIDQFTRPPPANGHLDSECLLPSVRDAIQRTADIIQDIDRILEK